MTLPFVVSIPHCGRDVPPEIRRQMALDDRQIIESVDFGTFEIFGRLPVAAVVHARWSRLVADLNRSADNRSDKGVIALNGTTTLAQAYQALMWACSESSTATINSVPG